MNSQASQRELIRMVAVRFLVSFLVFAAMFIFSAGTLAYWEAWAYLAVLLSAMLPSTIYMIKKEPDLLLRRLRMREKEASQKRIVKLSLIPFVLAFLLPGFDKRFGWSDVPAGLVAVADILILFGYGIIFLAFRENRYASRIIEVEREQSLISSGPYAIVRHPMYSGAILLYTLSPLALGSYWALIPAVSIIPFILARISNEENVLARDLNGYREYMQKVRFRLIPKIW